MPLNAQTSFKWARGQLQGTSRRVIIFIVGLLAIIGFLWFSFLNSSYYTAPYPSHHVGSTVEERLAEWEVLSDVKAKTLQLDLHTTRVLNHAAGFTLFENLYWKDWTFYIVTDQPWSIPNLTQIATGRRDRNTPSGHKGNVELLALRQHGVFYGVNEDAGVGRTMDLVAAMEHFGSAEEISERMLLNNDIKYTAHYYHWVGEMFTGAWRLYQNYGWRTGQREMPDFESISFLNAYWKAEAPGVLWKSRASYWDDEPGANVFFMKTFFPQVKIETQPDWEARAASGKMYRLSHVLLTDRLAGWTGPYFNNKPIGDVHRLFVASDWLLKLRHRILKDYVGPYLPKSGRPKILYTTRQNYWKNRKLATDKHEALIKALTEIQDEGLADVTVKQFGSSTSWTDQVAEFAGTDYLVGVHGNGLTHLLWMDPGSSVFEIQPQQCSVNDYTPLAVATGLTHYLVRGDEFCLPNECPTRGCTHATDYNVNQAQMQVDPKVITDEIRRLIVEKERHGENRRQRI